MTEQAWRTEPAVTLIEVRRFGSDNTIPILVEEKNRCGPYGAHMDNGCLFVMLRTKPHGHGVQLHLNPGDASRLSDLLRALAPVVPGEEPKTASDMEVRLRDWASSVRGTAQDYSPGACMVWAVDEIDRLRKLMGEQ